MFNFLMQFLCLLGIYLGMELLGQVVTLLNSFPKVTAVLHSY
jgi:hypothetical protein